MTLRFVLLTGLSAIVLNSMGVASAQGVLPATAPLDFTGDPAAAMVEGIHRYLDRATARSIANRAQYWNRNFSSPEAYQRSIAPNRERLKTILGLVDQRVKVEALELLATTAAPGEIASGDDYGVFAVRWESLPGVFGEGLLLEPKGAPTCRVVAMPDASWSPEMLTGLTAGLPSEAQFGRRLAENGCQVVIPTLIDRTAQWTSLEEVRRTNLPHREFLFRMSYELGRHLIGYEIQKILTAVDFFEARNRERHAPIGVFGYGEGGLLALYAAAVDERIERTAVSGYFQEREGLWSETIDRSVWSLLREFGDAEIAGLISPRSLIIEAAAGPEVEGPPPAPEPSANRAASGKLVSPPRESVRREFERAREPYERLRASKNIHRVSSAGSPGSDEALRLYLQRSDLQPVQPLARKGPLPDSAARLRRSFDQVVDYNQKLVRDSPKRREAFWSKANRSSPAAWAASTRHYRDYVWDEVIGRIPDPDRPASPRTRRLFENARFQGYEVMLDVWEDVFAYGVLLVPADIRPGERRPVVVVQHGLEGRPTDLVDPDVDHRAYHRYGARLAQEGFVVYAPQNPFIGQDRFRQILRKSHPLKLTLFSFILGQHQQTLGWLKSLPFVDAERIGFYGLSYGGKTAVRVPPLLDDYALSICSADFNEWVWKNTSVTDQYSYLFTQEYDMLEFNFANVINYAELASLMAPRPFMVERGHSDGVAPDEWVAYEFAKVRRFYDGLGLGGRAEIEFFNGPHEIHGEGTFRFLREHLRWK